jgi:hypothetical protein
MFNFNDSPDIRRLESGKNQSEVMDFLHATDTERSPISGIGHGVVEVVHSCVFQVKPLITEKAKSFTVKQNYLARGRSLRVAAKIYL